LLAEADLDAVERLLSDGFAAGSVEFTAANEGASAFASALPFGLRASIDLCLLEGHRSQST